MFMNSLFGENLFDDFFDDMMPMQHPLLARQSMPKNGHSGVMCTDVKEHDGAFELDIDLPGFKKEDVKVELKDGYMTVSAVRNEDNETKDENGRYLRRERYFGSCSRSFYVGDEVEKSDVKAKFADGILSLTVPKKEPALPQPSYIEIEG